MARLSALRLHLGYPVELRQQNLDLSKSNVLSFRIVQQMSCSHTDLHRRLVYQLKFANDRNVLSVKQLKRKKLLTGLHWTGRHSSSPQFPAARTRFYGLQWDKTSLVGRKWRSRPAEKEHKGQSTNWRTSHWTLKRALTARLDVSIVPCHWVNKWPTGLIRIY